MKEPEYLPFRKKYISTIWYLTYFYNIIITIFFYHPEIVNMNFNNVDNRILDVCKTFCIFDILLTPIFIKLIKCFTYDFFKSLEFNIINSFQSFADEAKAQKEMREYEKKNVVNYNDYGMATEFVQKLSNVAKAFEIAAKHEQQKKERERKRLLKIEIKKKNYRYNHLKINLLFMPHGSFQWYSLITSIYCTIVLVIDFTTEGYILWGLYFTLLIINLFSIQFSIYLDFFKTSDFITLLFQLLDLGTDFAFLYRINGINQQSINTYGETLLLFYIIFFLISYTSLLLLYYYGFMEKRIPNNGKDDNEERIKIYQNKQLYAGSSLGILGNIPLSILTIIIGNIESNGDNSITILSVFTSLLTFILSFSKLVESRQKNYKYEVNISRISEI